MTLGSNTKIIRGQVSIVVYLLVVILQVKVQERLRYIP